LVPQYLPPMAGGSHDAAVPGPVRDGRTPPVREIVVIEARKVFDFCFQEDVLERCFFVPDLGPGAQVTSCEIIDVTCMEVLDREPITDQEGLFLVSIQVNLTLRITILPSPRGTPVVVNRSIAFPKRVVLCAPTGTDVTCDVRGTCICTVQPVSGGGSIGEPNICCTIQLSTGWILEPLRELDFCVRHQLQAAVREGGHGSQYTAHVGHSLTRIKRIHHFGGECLIGRGFSGQGGLR